jgi:tRNA (Thr-GGU) A37 N-methylase
MCGVARQGMLAPATRGWIQLEGKLNPAEALDGIQQFSHVWIVFVFHQNTNASKYQPSPWRTRTRTRAWTRRRFILSPVPCRAMLGDKGLKAKVRPPRLGGARVGLFSTRTPHRPNPIGTSLVRLSCESLRHALMLACCLALLRCHCNAGLTIAKIERLERGVLHISGVDLVDGTPVLDIKPYLPRYDSLPDATGEQQLSHALYAQSWRPHLGLESTLATHRLSAATVPQCRTGSMMRAPPCVTRTPDGNCTRDPFAPWTGSVVLSSSVVTQRSS